MSEIVDQQLLANPPAYQRSADIDELVTALAKAQLNFAPIKKTATAKVRSEKASYDYKYATLDEVIDATRPALNAQGIAVMQFPKISYDGGRCIVSVTTTLFHGSQWISCTVDLLCSRADPQGIGSVMTYARRYSRQCVIDVAAEADDDGQAGMPDKSQADSQRAPQSRKDQRRQSQREQAKKDGDKPDGTMSTIAQQADKFINESEGIPALEKAVSKLHDHITKQSLPLKEGKQLLKKAFGKWFKIASDQHDQIAMEHCAEQMRQSRDSGALDAGDMDQIKPTPAPTAGPTTTGNESHARDEAGAAQDGPDGVGY